MRGVLLLSLIFYQIGHSLAQAKPGDFRSDSLAVRAILDSNGRDSILVRQVSITEDGRIVALNLKDWGISKLPGEVGALTALDTLDLSFNKLSSLPQSILSIHPKLMVNGNRLCEVESDIKKWIDENQYCKPGICIH